MKIKILISIILCSILPSFSLFGAIGLINLSQIDTVGIAKDSVGYLADKNMAYWFLTMAAIAIISWTYIAKWLFQQLESQRSYNNETVKDLVKYMKEDHAAAVAVMNRVTDILDKIIEKLEQK